MSTPLHSSWCHYLLRPLAQPTMRPMHRTVVFTRRTQLVQAQRLTLLQRCSGWRHKRNSGGRLPPWRWTGAGDQCSLDECMIEIQSCQRRVGMAVGIMLALVSFHTFLSSLRQRPLLNSLCSWFRLVNHCDRNMLEAMDDAAESAQLPVGCGPSPTFSSSSAGSSSHVTSCCTICPT